MEEGAERGMWAGGPTGGLGEGRGVGWVGMVQGLSWDTKRRKGVGAWTPRGRSLRSPPPAFQHGLGGFAL